MDPKNGMRRVHPGEILHDKLETLELSVDALSKALDAPVSRIAAILDGQRGVTATRGSSFRDTSGRLHRSG